MPFDGTGFRRTLSTEQRNDLLTLRRIREAISKPGAWTKGRLHHENGFGHCIQGWLEVEHANPVRITSLYLEPALPASLRGANWPCEALNRVVRYNDRKRTTQTGVTRLFDRAIARLESPTEQ